jgi:uncharacterized membrane protein YfcA
MEVIGFVAAAFIGVSLGLIGGGGSIITVPVLVYLFSIPPSLATSYSLFIVGFSSLVGAYKNYKKGLISFKTAFLFGASSITTVYLTRRLIIPQIPSVFTIGTLHLTQPFVIMIVFAILMLAVSFSMISHRHITYHLQNELDIFLLVSCGIGIGLITGFLGAGGGFLLVPALVLIMRLPMKQAIGTSLLIIAFNCLIGFTGDIGHYTIQWLFLLSVTVIAVSGLIVGDALNKKINGDKLKKAFGWFVLIMSIYIIVREILDAVK